MNTRHVNAFFILTATVFVAGITSRPGAVDIGRIAPVGLVNLGLRMAGVVRTNKGRIAARGIRVASRAHTARATVVEAPEIMSKRRTQPVRRGVTRRASGGNDS